MFISVSQWAKELEEISIRKLTAAIYIDICIDI